MKAMYNKSEIMKRAWSLKVVMGYSTFAQALKHSWLVAKNEMADKALTERQNKVLAIHIANNKSKKDREREAEHADFIASGLDFHTYTMRNYYANNRYNGD